MEKGLAMSSEVKPGIRHATNILFVCNVILGLAVLAVWYCRRTPNGDSSAAAPAPVSGVVQVIPSGPVRKQSRPQAVDAPTVVSREPFFVTPARPRPGMSVRDQMKQMVAEVCLQVAKEGMTVSTEDRIRELAQQGEVVVPELVKMLMSDAPVEVREPAARALALIGSGEAIAAILDQLGRETDPDARDLLSRTLQLMSGASAGTKLVDTLTTATDPVIERAVRDSMGRTADADSTKYLIAACERTNVLGQCHANLLGALADVRTSAAVPGLVDALLNSPNSAVRTAVATALGRIGTEDSVIALIDAIEASSPADVEAEFAEALSKVENKDAFASLILVFSQSTNQIARHAAAAALAAADVEGRAHGIKQLQMSK